MYRGKNRYMDEVLVPKSEYNNPSTELITEKKQSKPTEPCSADWRQSRTEEIRATSSKSRNSVLYSKHKSHQGRKWKIIPECEGRHPPLQTAISKVVTKLSRHCDQENDVQMVLWQQPSRSSWWGRYLGTQFNWNWWNNLGPEWRKITHSKIVFRAIPEGSHKKRFEYRIFGPHWNSTHLEEVRILWLEFFCGQRTHCWWKSEERKKTDDFLHTSQSIWRKFCWGSTRWIPHSTQKNKRPQFLEKHEDAVYWVTFVSSTIWRFRIPADEVQSNLCERSCTTKLYLQNHLFWKRTSFIWESANSETCAESHSQKQKESGAEAEARRWWDLYWCAEGIGKVPSHSNQKRKWRPKHWTNSVYATSTLTLTFPSKRLIFEAQEFQTMLYNKQDENQRSVERFNLREIPDKKAENRQSWRTRTSKKAIWCWSSSWKQGLKTEKIRIRFKWESWANWMSKEGITPSESMGWSSSKRKDQFVWRTGNEEPNSSRKSGQNESRNRKIMKILLWGRNSRQKIAISGNCLYDKRKIQILWVDCNTKSRITGSGEFIRRGKRVWWSWHSEQPRSIARSPGQPVVNPSSREVLSHDSLLLTTARNNTGYSGYVSENPVARERSSSAIFETWRSRISSYCGMRLEETDKSLDRRKNWWESRKIPRLYGIWKLESQPQDWSWFKNSRSSSQNAVDQRSWGSKVKWRIDDIAIDCRKNWFSWLRYAWCNDCVCSENASRQACAFPTKSRRRRAACSKVRSILTGEGHCLHDLRAFSSKRSIWSSTVAVRSVQYTSAELQCPGFRRTMGPSTAVGNRNSDKNGPGRTVQVKITGKILLRLRLYWLCMIKKLFETMGSQVIKDWRRLWGHMSIRRWELETSEPVANCGQRSNFQGSKREKSVRWDWKNAFSGK